jgi:hypothetical protein
MALPISDVAGAVTADCGAAVLSFCFVLYLGKAVLAERVAGHAFFQLTSENNALKYGQIFPEG